jgi:TonB-linked SusC/RagA family outer membrane protein
MFLFCVDASASISVPEVKLSIDAKNKTIREVLKDIEEQTQYHFFYNSEFADLDKIVEVPFTDGDINEVLSAILDNTSVSYKVMDNNFIIITPTTLMQQQSLVITGTVTDEHGEPIPGVNVVVKGTVNGVVTDVSGKYSIKVPDESITLEFSFIGYATQGISPKNRTVIDVVLYEISRSLDEVVVIGYGTQKKVNLTGAVSAVQGSELHQVPTSNLSNLIAGLVPGATVSQTNGRPGSASNIVIRGKGTWNNQNPLYVIDGFVRDKEAFDAIDPNEVETISVLKDAASASIYGSRAANGVLLVTTKKGKIQAPEITYKGMITTESRVKKIDQLSAVESAILFNDFLKINKTPDGDITYFMPDEIQYFQDHPDAYRTWLDQVWNTPVTQQHNLSVNGGTEKLRYFMSAGYYNGAGFLQSINYKKQNFRINVEANIMKGLTANVFLDLNNKVSNQPNWPNDGGVFDMWNIINGLMVRAPYNRAAVGGLPNGSAWHPISAINTGSNRNNNDDYNGILKLTYALPFVKGLELGASYNQSRSNQFVKQFFQFHPVYNFQRSGSHNHIVTDDAVLLNSNMIAAGSSYEYIQEDYIRERTEQFNTSMRYQNSFGKNNVGVVLVYEQTEIFSDKFMGRGETFDTYAIEQIDAASNDAARRTASGSGSELGRLSYVGRLNYDYGGKYLFEGSFRYDGSIIFPPKNRWGFFPSLSTGWRISDETFFEENIKFINNLKLRYSIGLLGNDAVTAYQYQQNYNYSGVMYYGTTYKGIALGRLPNENITWEKSRTNNLGIDAGFLDNALTFTGDFFYRHTYDILRSRILTVPGTFGATLPDENYAIVDVKGLDVSVGYRNQIGKVQYGIVGNIGYAIDNVVQIDVPANIRPYQNPLNLPLNTLKGYKSAGILRTQEDIDNYKAKVSTIFGRVPEIGQLVFQDIRGVTSEEPDGIIDANDQEVLSTKGDPRLNYGFKFDIAWKAFRINMLWQGLGMWDIMMDEKTRDNRINDNVTLFGLWRDYWTPENPNATMPRVGGSGIDTSVSQPSDFWIQNGSFLRLKDLSISYSLPQSIIEKIYAKNISFLLSGTNLLTLTKYKHHDPEQRELASYPTMRAITFGLNVTF